VLVTFSSEYWARVWLEETLAPFPLLLDPERTAYRAYRLPDSIWRAWGPRSIAFYLKALAGGRKIHGPRGWTGQMGGDFIVDPHQKLRFVHASVDPTDRPSIERLKDELRRLPSSSSTQDPASST